MKKALFGAVIAVSALLAAPGAKAQQWGYGWNGYAQPAWQGHTYGQGYAQNWQDHDWEREQRREARREFWRQQREIEARRAYEQGMRDAWRQQQWQGGGYRSW
jgi:hypothetical protein